MSASAPAIAARAGSAGVLPTLATAQFLMTLDSSVMNVSMATVASDVGTTITGIQTAITLYTLVMATLMITGGKLGTILGRRRAFMIGCGIYAAGSLLTAIAPTLPVLLIGWSVLEGIGAALIMPAVVALVAGNFAPAERPRAYGLIAAAAAIAVAAGPLIGGAATTYLSWRWVFVGEVVIALLILFLAFRITDAPPTAHARLDIVGTLLSITGLGTIVLGVLRSSEWGWVVPAPGADALFGIAYTFWFIVGGLLVMWLFVIWQVHRIRRSKEPLMQPRLLAIPQLRGGLILFFLQFMLQAGTFFIVPLFLSVVLELPAIETGLRIVPLSIALLLAAAGIPKLWPHASPRRVVTIGVLLLLAGLLSLLSGIDIDADAAIVSVPMILIGGGIGALASQLGAVTVSAAPPEDSGEVGGLQNTATNLGASLGTAAAGSILIAVLTTSLVAGIVQDPRVPDEVKDRASVELVSGVPFLSDTDLEAAMVASGADDAVTQAVVEDNRAARIDGLNASVAVLVLVALVALFFTRTMPTTQPGAGGASESTDTTKKEREKET